MMSSLMKILCIWLLLLSVERDRFLFISGSNLDEGQCKGLPNCVCMKFTSKDSNSTNLICENEINVNASVYFDSVRIKTEFTLFCVPDVNPKYLLKDYYNLMDLKNYQPYINIMRVFSCPEPPIPYSSFLSPPKSLVHDDIQSPDINSLIINCNDYRRIFFLQKKHFYGLHSLKGLAIHCHTMYDLPSDIFFDTTPSLSTIAIESTKVSSVFANTFSSLFDLQELSMSKNSIRSISDGTFNNLTSLLKLDLSHNSINNLDDNVFQEPRDLRRMNLSYNNIISLPRSISYLVNLTVLDISYNSVEEISSLEGLINLKRLYADFNKLIHINTSTIASLKSIEYIYLSGNALLNLDPIQFPLNKLYTFVLKHNSQTALPVKSFLSGDRISELIFSNSSIISIHPAFFENIPSIKTVDFSNNKLISIPEDLFMKNERLYQVILRENNITELLSNTFSNNPELEMLDISSNQISSLPDKIFVNNHELRYLDISNNQLTILSNVLFHNKSSLVELNAANNQLRFIDPALLSTSRRITHLDFSGNLLEHVPEDIFFPLMESLFYLSLDRNCISSLPHLQLPYVKLLNLSHNCLEYIQEGLFQNLSSIDKLDLSYNRIKTISNSPLLPQAVYMTLLDLSNNQLSDIPKEMLSTKDISIGSINISGNSLTHFYVNCIDEVNDLLELCVANNNLSYFGLDPNVESWILYLSIKYLDLSNNSLDFKEAGWFYDDSKSMWGKVTSLLRFKNLEILKLPSKMFDHTVLESPIIQLYHIDSNLQKSPGIIAGLFDISSLHDFNELVLLLSNNSVSTIFLDCRDDLNELRLLDLRYNKIRRLQHHDIMFTSPNAPRLFPLKNTVDRILHPRLNNTTPLSAPSPPLIVDLRGNLIRSVDISPNKVKKIFLDRNGTIPEGIYGHATILLDDNPFSCDCSMLNFLRIVQNDVAPVGTPQFLTGQNWIMPARIEVGNLSCWEPKSIRGSLISEPETWIHHILPLISLCSL